MKVREEQARKARAIPTFKEAAERYFKVHGDKWRNHKHRKQFSATLEAYAYPKLGALRVNDITTEDVRLAVEPIWRTIPETASRVRGRIENVLSWVLRTVIAKVQIRRVGTTILEHLLPAKGLIAKRNHHAALPYDALPEFWAALNEREGIAARALEFTILTAARTGEVIGATWDEIDLKWKMWIVPAGRMKARKEHRIPLSDRTLEILESATTERGKITFLSDRARAGLSNMAMAPLSEGWDVTNNRPRLPLDLP